MEELIVYLKPRRCAARSKRVVNIFNDESALFYFNYCPAEDPKTVSARDPFRKVLADYCDSEQELEMGSADELGSSEASESQEDDASCLEAGFIVSDVSDCELSDDDPALLKQQIRQANRQLEARRKLMLDLGDMMPVVQTDELLSF